MNFDFFRKILTLVLMKTEERILIDVNVNICLQSSLRKHLFYLLAGARLT